MTFTKGGILNSNQLELISGKKWKKGGILSATQLNELSSEKNKEDKTNKLYYFKDLKNGTDGSLPITQADLEGLDYSKTLTAEINGVKYPAEYYYHPRGYIPYFTIYPSKEMAEKYNLYVDKSTHSGDVFNIAVESNGISLGGGDFIEAWEQETGNQYPSTLTISIYEETALDDEFCVIDIVYDSESKKWKIDDDNPIELLKFISDYANKDGHPRSYYCGRVLYRLGLGGIDKYDNYDYDLYLNAFDTPSKTVSGDSSSTTTMISSTNFPTNGYSEEVTDSTISLEIAITFTFDDSTNTSTTTYSISVKIDGSEYPES